MRKHILLIGDDPYFRFAIELALKKKGYRVSQMGDGTQALKWLLPGPNRQQPRLDLILLDLELPSLPGEEILRRIRKEGIGTPTIVFSGYFNAPLYEELMGLDCLELLFKPVSEPLLLEIIDKAVAAP